MTEKQVTRYFCDVCNECFTRNTSCLWHETQHLINKEQFNMKLFEYVSYKNEYKQIKPLVENIFWNTWYVYLATTKACEAFKASYIARGQFSVFGVKELNYPTEPGWYYINTYTNNIAFGTKIEDTKLISKLIDAEKAYKPSIEEVHSYLIENNILNFPKENPQDWEQYLCEKEDGTKYIRLIACLYYSEINYTYGEAVDQGPPIPAVQEWVNKYPEYFIIEECYECCGCGDW